MEKPTLYMVASSRQKGALGIFHAFADEAVLSARLDVRVGARKMIGNPIPLQDNELRYGWLWGDEPEPIDEVMLAKPKREMRVLMTHGGTAVGEAVESFFRAGGFVEAAMDGRNAAYVESMDELYDTLLMNCVTEAQAAAVLRAREEIAANRCGPLHLPGRLMATHRVVLAGPPNAGKSSLLNALAGYDRAFVDHEAGATRDIVDELVDIGGYAVLLGDMPGFCATDDGLAAEAWRRARERLGLAEAVWFVCDGSKPWQGDNDAAAREIASALTGLEGKGGAPELLVVVNKSDAAPAWPDEPWKTYFPASEAVRVCSLPDGDAAKVVEAYVVRKWDEAAE